MLLSVASMHLSQVRVPSSHMVLCSSTLPQAWGPPHWKRPPASASYQQWGLLQRVRIAGGLSVFLGITDTVAGANEFPYGSPVWFVFFHEKFQLEFLIINTLHCIPCIFCLGLLFILVSSNSKEQR